LTQILIYVSIAFVTGFGAAWLIRTFAMARIKKENKSALGYLESEKLRKETLQKENLMLHQAKQGVELDLKKRLNEVIAINKLMDQDILLLQKSYEETEAMLEAKEPTIHAMKLKLIEANNTIARYKAQLGIKDNSNGPLV
jgi:hypothetical protein